MFVRREARSRLGIFLGGGTFTTFSLAHTSSVTARSRVLVCVFVQVRNYNYYVYHHKRTHTHKHTIMEECI